MEFKEQIQRILENVPKVYEAGRSSIKNEVSNALKGSASGEIVALKDVSPLEHILGVKVSTPHIADIEAVKVRAQGKNLFDYRAWIDFVNDANKTGGIAKTDDVLNGEECFSYPDWTDAGNIPFNNIKFKPNTQYTISCEAAFSDPNMESYNRPTLFVVHYTDGTFEQFTINVFNALVNKFYSVKRTTAVGKTVSHLTILRYGRDRIIYIKKSMQIEVGTEATEAEPYIEPTEHPVNADGTVTGIKPIYPSTTLTTDTEGVLIEVEYNKDINKAFAELQQAIILLGGII